MRRHLVIFRRRRMIVAAVLLVGAAMCFYFFRGSRLRPAGQWSAQAQDLGAIVYTPDGKTLISGGEDPIRLWDPATGRLKLTLSTYGAAADRFTVAPGGDLLGCTRSRRVGKEPIQQTAEFWDLTTGSRTATIEAPVVAIAFSRAAPIAATLSYGEPSSSVELWSLPQLAPLAALPPVPSSAASIAFSPDGKLLAVGQLGFVELFDVATRTPIRRFNGPATGYFVAIAFAPDGRTIAGAVSTTGPPRSSGVWTWDVATARPNVRLNFGRPMYDSSFSADGGTLAIHLQWYVFNRKDRIDVYDVQRGRQTCSLSVRRPWMRSVALSPDAQHLAVGFQPLTYTVPATIGVWDVDN